MRRVLAFLLAVMLFCLCGCRATEQTPSTEVPATEPPTEASTEPPTEPPTEPIPDWLHSGIREDGTFDEGTLFIGDSLTAGLFSGYLHPNSLSDDAMVMATPGATPVAYFVGPKLEKESEFYSYYSWEFEGKTMSQGVSKVGESVRAIYFMMGTNFIESITEQTYIDIITHMLESCPNATIYLQLVPYSLSDKVDEEQINWRVWTAYNYFNLDMEEPRVKLIETQVAIDYNLKSDGIHLTEEGYRCWYQALVDYAEKNGIPQ